jgi:L-rhamnose mutarotase
MKRYCFALDLKNDPKLIEEYENWHLNKNVWPEVKQSIIKSGIIHMEIYRTGNRLFMIMETDDYFSFENKAQMDTNDPKVQEWEELMWKYQLPLPWAKEGEKWVPMNKIFEMDYNM